MRTKPTNKNICNILIDKYNTFEYGRFIFDCYITENTEWSFQMDFENFKSQVLNHTNGDPLYTQPLNTLLLRAYHTYIQDLSKEMFDKGIAFFSCRFSEYDTDYDFDEFRFAMVDEFIDSHDIDYSWGLEDDDEEPETENNN